jgi:ABC-type sugar transport system substrate-binding protein
MRKRISLLLAVALTAVILLVAGTAGGAFALGSGGDDGKVTICHRTGSETNPWVQITVGVNALPAHLAHGDFIVDEHKPCPPPKK